ncbi:MAG TPA: plastocyanin/azurin family copper-binding protein [Solirubrobacteraceae bacterium]|jgi:plastocyanin|nr:plastocyanin/azurin family copper-binding protein [Solirubrobacteraceae bacterium]
MSRRALFLLASVAAASAVALAPTGALGGASAARTRTVALQEFRFHPATLNVNRGDSVKWVWRDQVEHNVTFHSTHSRTQVSGTFTVRFTRRGSFSYRCTIHAEEGMRGKIVVH